MGKQPVGNIEKLAGLSNIIKQISEPKDKESIKILNNVMQCKQTQLGCISFNLDESVQINNLYQKYSPIIENYSNTNTET